MRLSEAPVYYRRLQRESVCRGHCLAHPREIHLAKQMPSAVHMETHPLDVSFHVWIEKEKKPMKLLSLVVALSLSCAGVMAPAFAEDAVASGQMLLAPADRRPLPLRPVLTGMRPGDTVDLANLQGRVVLLNFWYEY
jgi:hypothetical protein